MKIAIIGGGIAGTSAAYYLSKYPEYQIDLYEMSDHLGGRVYTHTEYNIDQGAEFFISNQTYLLALIEHLNQEDGIQLEKEEYLSARAIMLENRSVILPSKKHGLLSKIGRQLKMLRYLGIRNISSLTKLMKIVVKFEKIIDDLYAMLDNADSTVLFGEITDKYSDLISVSLKEYFLQQGLSENIIDNFIDPLVSTVYMLDMSELNAFHGAMIFAAKNNTVYHIKNGNSRIFDALDHYFRSTDNVTINLNSKITEFSSNELELTMNNKEIRKYDFVFFAIPHENISEINIQSDSLRMNSYLEKISKLKHHFVYHHLISGDARPEIRKLFSNGADTIFTGTKSNIWEINSVEKNIFDISARSAYDETDFALFFKTFELIHTKFWKPSYPVYSPENMKNLPSSMYIDDNIAMGTEFLISSLDSGINIARRVERMVNNLNKNTIRMNLIEN